MRLAKEGEFVKLGQVVRDRVSGYTGIVNGITDFLYGCRRIQVRGTGLKDGLPIKAEYFDEPELEVIANNLGELARPTGGPRGDEGQFARKDPE